MHANSINAGSSIPTRIADTLILIYRNMEKKNGHKSLDDSYKSI